MDDADVIPPRSSRTIDVRWMCGGKGWVALGTVKEVVFHRVAYHVLAFSLAFFAALAARSASSADPLTDSAQHSTRHRTV
jgi:hypothetical protein